MYINKIGFEGFQDSYVVVSTTMCRPLSSLMVASLENLICLGWVVGFLLPKCV